MVKAGRLKFIGHKNYSCNIVRNFFDLLFSHVGVFFPTAVLQYDTVNF